MKKNIFEHFGDPMDFELAMRQFFGDNAYQIAGFAGFSDNKYVKSWLIKAVKRMLKDANSLDSLPRHKEILIADLEELEKAIKKWNSPWDMIYRLFFICSRLFGYDYCTGIILYTPFWWQNPSQYDKTKRYQGNDSLKEWKGDEKNFKTKQRAIIDSLKREGFNDFKIAMILNTTEYEIRKIRNSFDIKRK